MDIVIADIVEETTVDGPGLRTSIYLQGCPIHCQGCHNKHLWDITKGTHADTVDTVNKVISNKYIDGITILGGEPFYQPQALYDLVKLIRALAPNLSIWIYTGYTLEQLLNFPHVFKKIITYCNTIVTGPFIESLKTTEPFIGSSNQQIICVQSIRSLLFPY